MSESEVLSPKEKIWNVAGQDDAPVKLKDTQAKDLVFEPGHNHDARLGALQQAV